MTFLDSGFFVACKNQKDNWHDDAISRLAPFLRGQVSKPHTCDYVLDEAVTTVWRRTGSRKLAAATAKEIHHSTHWLLHHVTVEDVRECVELCSQHDTVSVSFTDWVVAWMAKKTGQQVVLSTDKDMMPCLTVLGIAGDFLLTNQEFRVLRERRIKERP